MILLKAVIAILVGATIGSLLGEFNYALDLFSNFKVHVAAVLTLTIFVFWYLRQTIWAMLSLACTCIHLIAIAPWILQGEGQLDITGDSVGVLLSNIGMNRGDLQKLATLINEEQPEIVGLLEVTPRILSNLNLDSNEYRYRLEYPTTAGYEGLALYSKLPVSDGNIVRFGATASPTLVANITIGKNKIEFILTHPHWPLGLDRAARRNSQLQQMSAYIGESDWTVLLAGDLNTTMWSAHYKEFEAVSGLINARYGFGIAPTWPSIPLIGIPIDHVMVSPPSRIEYFRVHQSIGSDHLPISARIAFVPGESGQKPDQGMSN